MTRNHAYKRLYSLRQGDLTMIVEAEWNRRLGRGFNSRRLHQEHTGPSRYRETDCASGFR